jgi:hypothetical protein
MPIQGGACDEIVYDFTTELPKAAASRGYSGFP